MTSDHSRRNKLVEIAVNAGAGYHDTAWLIADVERNANERT